MHTLARLACAAALALATALGPTAAAQSRQSVVSPDEMREWLTYLASDALQGRQVFSEGLGLAASYISDHLAEWRVQPAGDAGTYFQTVRLLGMRTRSNSSVTVTVNGESRTFKDGDGVTFPRNQGSKQIVNGRVAFAGYGVTFAPLQQDDYAGLDVGGRVAVFLGRSGPKRFNAAHNRILAARGRVAIETHRALASIGPAAPPPAARPSAVPEAQRVDFQTSQRLDAPIVPQITAGDEFFSFLFSESGVNYTDLKGAADKQEPLPRVDLSKVSITINVDAAYDVVQTRLTRNVVGLVAGTDAALKDSYVVLGAHYDHLGYEQFGVNQRAAAIASCAGQTRPAPRPDDRIVNGADDDGSGIVALMALAKAFARGPQPRRSLLFVWHTGEEGGLVGSRYMADHPVVPLDKMAAVLNIDMIGRNRCDDPSQSNTVYLVGSDRISTELHNLSERANAALRAPLSLNYELNDQFDLESIYTRSDHYSYATKGIPVIFYTTGLHRDYHFVTDEVDKILFDKMARVTELVYETAARVGNLAHMPARDYQGPRIGNGRTGSIP